MPDVIEMLKKSQARKEEAKPPVPEKEYVESEESKSQVLVARVEKERAEALLEAANKMIDNLNGTIGNLKTDLRKHAQAAAIMKDDHKNLLEEMSNRKAIDREAIKDLQIQVAKLTGKLEQSKKVLPVIKPAAPMPLVIPEFTAIPIRGSDGKISSATIKPVGLN